MKKIVLVSCSLLLFFALSGCSSNKKESDKEKQLAQQISTLKHEKKELEILLENEKQKNHSPISSDVERETSETNQTEELETLFQTFIRAEFEQDNEALEKVTTGKLYTILVDRAGEKEPDLSFSSTVKSITLYKAEQRNEEEATLIGKIEIETKVGDFPPNRYQQLVECIAVKNSSGVFQVDSQVLTNLAK